jgi:hypothetical protein
MLPILADAFLRASLQNKPHERRWDAPRHWRKGLNRYPQFHADRKEQDD